MKPTPPGWPRLSSALVYQNGKAAIDWLAQAFAFEVRERILDDAGNLEHSELTYGDAVVMVSEEKARFAHRRAPANVGGANTQNLFMYVDDVEAHHARAKAAGAVIIMELKENDYGPKYWTDRTYECRDIGGHHWWFSQRLRTG